MSPGKQKQLCLPSWQDTHRTMWPGYGVPDLLTPINVQRKRKRDECEGGSYFQEQTVPTSMMMSIFVFGVSNPKRNPCYRLHAAKPLVDVVSQCCRQGDLQLTLPAVGDQAVYSVPIPRDGNIPVQSFLRNHQMREVFLEEWGWMLQDWFETKIY